MIKRETLYRWVDEVISQRIKYGTEEHPDIPEIDELSDEQLAYLRDAIDSMRADLSILKSFVDDRFRGRLRGKAFRFGDKVYRGRNGSKLVPYDKDKILDFLGDDWRTAIRPEFRTTAIRAIAKKRGLNEQVIIESLFERVDTEQLDVVPVNKAPKFLKELLDEDSKIVEIGD